MATTTPVTAPAAANPTTRHWPLAYRGTGPRDRRLDFLRGYALFAMAVNHLGLHDSYVHTVSGRSSFLVSAAEVFLFVSGFTLGYISIGRPAGAAVERLWHRTWIVYLATIGISFAFATVALTTHLELWGGFEAAGYTNPWAFIGSVMTMQTAVNGADILVAYVLYLAAGIAALRLMEQGRSWMVMAATTTVYAISQLAGPETLSLGFASFRILAANAPLFFGGLLLGYHRHWIAQQWRRVPIRRCIEGAVVVAALLLGWAHGSGWEVWPGAGDLLTAGNPTEPLWVRESEMPLAPMLVVFLYLWALWIVVDVVWVPLRAVLGWLMLPLGEASLFTFTAHLVAIPVIVNLAIFPGDDLSRWEATMWTVAYVLGIWLAVLVRRRVLEWLRAGTQPREWFRAHGPATAVAALAATVVVLGFDPAGAAGPWGEGDDDAAFVDEDEDIEGEIADGVGAATDRYHDGELDRGEVLALIPLELDAAEHRELGDLLDTEPELFEEVVVDRLLEEGELLED